MTPTGSGLWRPWVRFAGGAAEPYREERQVSQVAKAERVLGQELRRRGWTEATLGERAKGDREKMKIAVRLRRETLVTVAWIAARLQMGSVAHVNTRLYQWRQVKGS